MQANVNNIIESIYTTFSKKKLHSLALNLTLLNYY